VWSGLFGALFLGEKLTQRKIWPLVAALAGLVLVVSSHLRTGEPVQLSIWAGVGFLSAILSGAAVTAIRAARRTESSWSVYGSFTLFGLLTTAPFGLWHWQTPSGWEWLLLSAVGASSIAAQLFMTYAYRWLDNLSVGVFFPLAPVTALLLGALLLGEPVSGLSVAGTALALGGVVASSFGEARHGPEAAVAA